MLETLRHDTGNRPRALYRGPGGELVVITRPFERGEELQGLAAGADVYGRDGEKVAALQTEVVPDARVVRRADGGMYVSPMHYAASAQALFVRGNELLLSDGHVPELSWYGLDGRLRRTVRIELERNSVTDSERDAVAAALDRALETAPERGDERERVLGKNELRIRRDYMAFADPRPAWSTVVADDSGRVWLREPRPVRLDYYANEGWRHRVVDAQGEYLGDSTWPPLLEASVARNHLLAAVFDGATLEVVLTAYRIVPRRPIDD